MSLGLKAPKGKWKNKGESGERLFFPGDELDSQHFLGSAGELSTGAASRVWKAAGIVTALVKKSSTVSRNAATMFPGNALAVPLGSSSPGLPAPSLSAGKIHLEIHLEN